MSIPISSSMQLWPFAPIQDDYTLNQDMAIPRFCAERMDQEPDWNDGLFDIETWSSSFDSSSPPCSVTIDEEYSSFVDSVINTSLYEEVVETNDEVGSYLDDAAMPPALMDSPNPDSAAVDKGLELVNLLLACAEAVGCRDTTLAASMLNQIWALANPIGDSLQRVSFYFAMGLKSRLSLLHNIGATGSLTNAASATDGGPIVTKEEKIEALHLLYQNTPYIAFGVMAANDAICEAAQGKDQLHIIDLGMPHALQWPSLIRMLASRPEGPPRVRITRIAAPGFSISEHEPNMQLLINEATAVGMLVEFRALDEPASPSLLTADKLELREGEILFVNSMMHLHKYVKESRGSLKAILIAIKKLRPTLVTVVEQDANHNGPFFLARFLESLHYYSAVFDSLDASLLRPSAQRMMIEWCYFAEEIRNIVACEGKERVERHERADQWRRQLGRAGFQGVGLGSVSQARMLVSAYGCDGYTVGSEKGCLLLGWKGRPIMWASAWQVNSASSS